MGSDLEQDDEGLARPDRARRRILPALEAERVAALGKQGAVTGLLKTLGGDVAGGAAARGAAHPRRCARRSPRRSRRARRRSRRPALEQRLATERLDMTLPVAPAPQGSVHPVSQVMDELAEIFADLGFSVATGPGDRGRLAQFHRAQHPRKPSGAGDARHLLFRPRPTPTAGRCCCAPTPRRCRSARCRAQQPPIRIIAPGRTYRSDSDATHTPMFHQVEGLVIDRGITLGHLKWTLETFLKAFFERDDIVLRLRPSLLPVHRAFGRGRCRLHAGERPARARRRRTTGWSCSARAWSTRKVIADCGLDPDEWQGFAFGCGIDRLAMLKYGMDDLRAFFDGDLRWLRHYGFRALDVPTLSGGVGRMKFTLSWLKEHLETEAALDDDRRDADRDRARGRGRRESGREARAVHRRQGADRRAAPAGRQAAGADRRCRRPASRSRSSAARPMRARAWSACSARPAPMCRAAT